MLEPVAVSGTVSPVAYGAMSACCGAGAARGCATRTTGRQVVASGGGFTSIPIPPYAYAVQFISEATFFVSTTSIILSGSGLGGAFGGVTYVSPANVVPDPLSITSGAQSLIVSNDGTEDIRFEAQFLIGV